MNLTIKKEWYDAAQAITNAKNKAEFFDAIMRYFFEGAEPDDSASDEALMFFRLIRGELDRDKQEKIKREVRKFTKKQQPKADQTPTKARPTADQVPTAERPAESKKFAKPTVGEIAEYIKEKGYGVNPQQFFNYYESNGWRVGRNPMKNWKAAVTNWANNAYSNGKKDAAAGTVWGKEHDAAAGYMDLM